MNIPGRTFLVTGAASGLGAACARELTQRGANVVLADVNAEASREIAAQIGEHAALAQTDVTQPRDVQAAIDLALARFGGLSGAVNCAGILGAARIAGRDGPHDFDLFRRVIEVNLIGTFNVMRLAAAAIIAGAPQASGAGKTNTAGTENASASETDNERGVIINTSSVAAFEGQIGQAAYAASKGGVASLTLPAARELAQFGVRVMAIAPGVFATSMMEGMPPKVQESLESQSIFPPRLGQPEEFAALVRHIIENPMLNGCTLRLDGAVRLGPK